MEDIEGWLLLAMGVGLVLVALQGAKRGWLPNGPNGFKQGEGVQRESRPVAFWFFFLLYFIGGAYVALFALRLLTGDAGTAAQP